MRRSRRALAVIFSLFVATLLVSAVASEDTVKGYVLDSDSAGLVGLFTGSAFQITPETRILRAGQPYVGRLLIGQEVEVKGTRFGDDDPLVAREVHILTPPKGGRVKGTAIIDAVRGQPGDFIFEVDGRALKLAGARRTVEGDGGKFEVREGGDRLQPGMYIEYEGRPVGEGLIQVETFRSWPNVLEPKEAELEKKFSPKTVFPKNKSDKGAYLIIGGSRLLISPNSELQLYLHKLGQRLVPTYSLPEAKPALAGRRFSFHLVQDSRPFAFAFPGGAVVVSTAMLTVTANEAQLAFVLAHEIAHAVQEHGWQERKYHKKKLRFLRWATAGVGYVVESAIRQGYSRNLEAQADRWAIAALVRAGIDPREVFGFLKKMESRQKGTSAWLWDSHSAYGNRREKLMAALLQFSLQGLDYANLLKNSADFTHRQGGIPRGDNQYAKAL